MRNIRSALNRHLRVIGKNIDIVKDNAFHKANDLLHGQLKQNVRAGLSKPTKHKPVIDKRDIVKIICQGYCYSSSVELRHIVFMSGHRNEASVRSYNRNCTSDQQYTRKSLEVDCVLV
ncbi:uncharacterized protein [Haliotis cracherodii]|uniref:uncharacterized protein n=1 Tax=Haliotis cracherodii TaxID=6455 RepID=UPI0039EA5A53